MTAPHRDDYLLGVNDIEIERLGLQHRVWRPRVLDAWRRAGFNVGQTLLDVGCGPGYATLDMAELVGPAGRVYAFDRSQRFLDVLEAKCRRRQMRHVTTADRDLEADPLGVTGADGAWCRWVLAFLNRPGDLVRRIAAALRPGARFVSHEYFDYRTWRLSPRCPELEEFVALVCRSWRESGGEPDAALDLPGYLREAGFHVESHRPLIDVVRPSDYVWQWPASFLASGLQRLTELGYLNARRAQEIGEAFAACERAPTTLMITPAVLEIIAVRDAAATGRDG
ncbi:MAG TPA: methyltransferase domain-containing protein [Gemmatimonadaceae bacterium]|nr:methyltransferase domain-containing protein [Gemmatimonadaceae bacterium]